MTTTKITNHTPGPWVAESFDRFVREEATGGTIARVCENDGHTDEKARRAMPFKANARLIAAAPEMYEALKWALARLEGHDEQTENTDIRAVLAKVEGAK